MIEVKLWYDDTEGIRDFGLLLLQNGYVYELRKNGDFALFRINAFNNEEVKCMRTKAPDWKLDYSNYSLSIGEEGPIIEFKAFALKIF